MVSKRKILGKSSVIFLTIGTTQFQFNRLFETVDETLVRLNFPGQLVVQSGNTKWKWKFARINSSPEFTNEMMVSTVRTADKIISHGGFGTLHTIAQNSNKMPLIVARLQQYKEHINDHQKYFLSYCAKKFPQNYRKFFVSNNIELFLGLEDFILNSSPANLLSTKLFAPAPHKKLIEKISEYIGVNYLP